MSFECNGQRLKVWALWLRDWNLRFCLQDLEFSGLLYRNSEYFILSTTVKLRVQDISLEFGIDGLRLTCTSGFDMKIFSI